MRERLKDWLVEQFKQNWVTLLLVAILVSTLAYSLDEANWVQNDRVFINAFNLGLLFGLLLARSRFGPAFVAFYAVFISLIMAIQAVGGILPSLGELFATPFAQVVDAMNLRLFELSLRFSGWVDQLQAGGTVEDTGLFVLLVCFLLSLCGIWLVWSLVRLRWALPGLLPIGLLFAINVHLSRQPLLHFWLFLFCAVLLVARSTFVRQHENWQQRRVDFPDSLGLEWGGMTLALTIVILVVARLGPLVGTPEGWQIFADLMERTREQTSDTAERWFGGVNPPPPPPADRPQVRVNTPNMGEIGGALPLGFEAVMWVSTNDPPPVLPDMVPHVPTNPTRLHYWRSGIYDTYTGRGWEAAPMRADAAAQPEDLPETPPEGRYYLLQRYEIAALHSGALFSVNDPLQTSADVRLRETLPDTSRLLEGQVEAYEVISLATRLTANQLMDAPLDYPAEIRSTYLHLPETLPGRVRALSQRLAEGTDNPYHKAIRIQEYLRLNFPYDLSAQPAPAQRDLVDYFLFDLQTGFCTHYASAMVVMLRAVDVPARVVTGYAMGDWDPSRSAYRVPVGASHAWVEVYFPGYGWVEFEPTAYRPAFEYPEETPASDPLPPVARIEPPAPVGQGWVVALLLVGALALLALPFVLLRVFTGPRQAPAVQVDSLYRQMRRALGWAGLRSAAHVTPDEYLLAYGGQLQPYARLNNALRQATDLYRQTTYSPHPPDERRVRAASQLWQLSMRDWLVLWLRARWNRIRSRE